MSVIVLSGAGVEDARGPLWGHMYRALVDMGHEVFTFDPIEASGSARRGTPQQQWEWVLGEVKPAVVIEVPCGDEFAYIGVIARDRGFIVHTLGIAEFVASGNVPPRVNTELLRPADVTPVCDAVFVGAASPERAQILMRVIDSGLLLRIYGDGWNAYEALSSSTYGAVPYSELARIYGSASVVIALPFELENNALSTGLLHGALEAAACARPVVTVDTTIGDYLTGSEECVVVTDVAHGIRMLIDDPVRSHEIGVAARMRVEREHGVSKTLDPIVPATSLRVVKDGPKVTVVTGMYNIEEFVGGAVESVLSQTMDDFELLIVDDGSPDNARGIVERYLGDPRVKLLDHHANIGQTGRFDLIWRSLDRYARGEFWTGLGGDDLMVSNRLELLVDAFDKEPQVDVVHGGCWWIDESGQRTGELGLPFSYDSSSLLRMLLLENIVMMPAVMLRRSIDRAVGAWAFGFACDYHYWVKSALSCRYRYLPVGLTDYRRHEKSASTGTAGLVASGDEAGRVRSVENSRHTLLDLYPSIGWASNVTGSDWAAAHIDVANSCVLRTSTAKIAIDHYEAALEYRPDLRSRIVEGLKRAHSLLDGSLHETPMPILSWRFGGHGLLQGNEVSTMPFDIPVEHASKTFWWDGSPLSVRRILMVVDWQHPELAMASVQMYLHAFEGVPDVELVFLTLGLSEDQALRQVTQLIPANVALDEAPSLTLETCDSIGFLPLDRYIHAIDCTPAAAQVGATQNATAALPAIADALRIEVRV